MANPDFLKKPNHRIDLAHEGFMLPRSRPKSPLTWKAKDIDFWFEAFPAHHLARGMVPGLRGLAPLHACGRYSGNSHRPSECWVSPVSLDLERNGVGNTGLFKAKGILEAKVQCDQVEASSTKSNRYFRLHSIAVRSSRAAA